MKIAIAGYSGSGKSTLAETLGAHYGSEVLHLDKVQFLPNWQVRNEESKRELVRTFLDTHNSWIIDGNYSKLFYDRRMEEADRIVLLLFNRLTCLWRVTKRYLTYRGRTRSDMAEGCDEKLDAEFIRWVLWEGRTKEKRGCYAALAARYPNKTVILRNQRELTAFMNELNQ